MLLLFWLVTVTTFYNLAAQDISSCCTSILLESSGVAQTHQSNRLGEYRLTGIYNERPLYTSISSNNGDEFLFYLRSKNKGLWMVGPEAGQFNGGLAHRGDSLCVENVAAGQWKFTDGKSWRLDEEIEVRCLDSPQQGLPRCLYEDQTAFLGEDLPAVFGGGGVETNRETSSECIDLCEKTSGCKYWTWVMEEKVNCFLKKTLVNTERRPKHVSGSDPSACTVTNSAVTTPVTTPVTEPKYNENEINGKFKIMMGWDDKFNDPESQEFQDLANTIETDLESMLREERDLSDQVESFTVKVEKFRRGSVVCDFKVNYILKEAYIAIPFAIKPANITNAMSNNFKFKKGILFQRFLIAGGSFNASSPVDHCEAKGCSHKCNYDYSVEDYVCTCPPTLQLGSDGLVCLEEDQESSSRLPEIEVTLLPTDCLWSPWSDWSDCSQCGTPGNKERTRTVVVPERNGGSCAGSNQEFVECEEVCEETTVGSADEPNVEIVTSVSIENADEVMGRTESVATTLADEVTEKTTEEAAEVLEPETGMDVEVEDNVMVQSTETMETTTVSGDTTRVVEQSTEEGKARIDDLTTTEKIATESSIEAETVKDEIIYPLPQDPTETTTTSAEETDLTMSTETMPDMTTETDTTLSSVTTEKVVDLGRADTDITTEDIIATDATTMSSVSDAEPKEDLTPVDTTTIVTNMEDATEPSQNQPTTSTPVEVKTESVDDDQITTENNMGDITTVATEEEQTDVSNDQTEVIEMETETEIAISSSTESAMVPEEVEINTERIPRIDILAETTTYSIQEIPAVSTQSDIDSLSQVVEVTTVENDIVTDVTQTTVNDINANDVELTTVKDDVQITTTENVEETMINNEATTETNVELTTVMEYVTTVKDDVKITTADIVELKTVKGIELTTEKVPDFTTERVEATTLKGMVEVTTVESITETEDSVTMVTTIRSRLDNEVASTTVQPMEDASTTVQPMEDVITTVQSMEDVSTTFQSMEDVSTTVKTMEDVSTTVQPMEDVSTTVKTMEDVITTIQSMEDVSTTVQPMEDVSTTVKLMEDVITTVQPMEDVSTTVQSMEDVITTVQTMEDVITTVQPRSRIDDEVVSTTVQPMEDVSTTVQPMEDVSTTVQPKEDVSTTVQSMEDASTTVQTIKDASTTVQTMEDASTTVQSMEDVITTVQPMEDVGKDQEFLCEPVEIGDDTGDLPMSCVQMSDQKKTVMLLIPRDVIGNISINTLFDKNVKIVVKDFMVMDIDRSPRRL